MSTKSKEFNISSIVNEINIDVEKQMQEIDWGKSAIDINRMVKLSKFNKRKHVNFFDFSLQFMTSIVAFTLIIGVLLGYFLSIKNVTNINPSKYQTSPKITLTRLESTLNKREINIYFAQAHLLLTEIMEVCVDNTIKIDTKYLNNRRVKKLLKKNRYFNKNSSDSQWLVSRNLLGKIEWVLLEILMADGELGCEIQKKLQKYITKERLLFKLRLLSSEASFSEV